MMPQTEQPTLPTPETLLDAWSAWHSLIGVTEIQTEEEYDRIAAILNIVLDATRDIPGHPLEGALIYLSNLIEAYDDKHYNWPPPSGPEMLRYLMEEGGLTQADLADCAPQHRISEILSGKRAISKTIAKKLAQRFHMNIDAFL